MINVNLLDKFKYFINILKDNSNLMIIIGGLLFFAFFMLLACKKKYNFIKIMLISLYFLLIAAMVFMFREHLAYLLDYLMECIINNLLFPNLAIYMGVLLIINIIVISSIFNNKVKYYVKSINIVYFIITQLFLYLIIDNIIINDINVYEKLSIYTNQNLLILIELSMQLFVVWIVILGMIRFIDYLMTKSEKSNNKLMNNGLVVEIDKDQNSNYIEEMIEYVPIKKKKAVKN